MVTHTRDTGLKICREDVSISDVDILARYIGITQLPCTVQSPLRDTDKNPSFSFQERGGVVYWKDFGTGESGTLIGLLAKLWNVSYKDALLKIQLDTEFHIPRISLIRKYKGKIHVTSNSTIKVKVREWKEWDTKYWEQYGITKQFCEWCNVYPISHAFFTKEEEKTKKKHTVSMPMDKIAYAYFEWKDGNESIKLYQPYSKKMKWLSKHDRSVWDLWRQAFRWADEKSNSELIITSSRKDAMCLWRNLGIPAMSLQGEGYLPKPQVMKQVLEKFKTVYLWYDNDFEHENDNPGQDNAKKLIELYPSLHNICIPSTYRSKDPSDLYKNFGGQVLRNIWENQRIDNGEL